MSFPFTVKIQLKEENDCTWKRRRNLELYFHFCYWETHLRKNFEATKMPSFLAVSVTKSFTSFSTKCTIAFVLITVFFHAYFHCFAKKLLRKSLQNLRRACGLLHVNCKLDLYWALISYYRSHLLKYCYYCILLKKVDSRIRNYHE